MALWGDAGPSSGAGLYDTYATGRSGKSSTRSRGPVVGETKSAILRRQRTRLNVYLNSEGVGVTVIGGPKGHGTIVMLPMECDTLEEVLPLIQLKLKLDERMLYAAEVPAHAAQPLGWQRPRVSASLTRALRCA